MPTANTSNSKKLNRTQRLIIIAGVSIAVIIFVVHLVLQPTRSVNAYCQVFKQEDAKLAQSHGDTYGVKPFTHSSNNPHDFAASLRRLDKVAPNDIEPDVKTLKQVFEKIDSDPSLAISASLSGMGAESNVATWTEQHCTH